MERYIKSTSHNMIHLCVDKVQDYQIQGVVYNNTLEEPFQFTDIHNLVLNIDKIFDQNGNPQSSQIKRSFQKQISASHFQLKPKAYCEYEEFLEKKGELATFDIWIKSRSHSTWQGILFCKEEKLEFANILELIKNISNFLSL